VLRVEKLARLEISHRFAPRNNNIGKSEEELVLLLTVAHALACGGIFRKLKHALQSFD
jgi:hypothetical protein